MMAQVARYDLANDGAAESETACLALKRHEPDDKKEDNKQTLESKRLTKDSGALDQAILHAHETLYLSGVLVPILN